jgi:hypothetical protein
VVLLLLPLSSLMYDGQVDHGGDGGGGGGPAAVDNNWQQKRLATRESTVA